MAEEKVQEKQEETQSPDGTASRRAALLDALVEENPRPEGLPDDQEWERVDFETADATTIQRRFNRLYASTKQAEAALVVAASDNRKLADRMEKLENAGEADRTATKITELKAEKVKAMEGEEHARVVEIDDQIQDLKQPKPEPKVEVEPKQEDPGWFTPARQGELVAWANQSDEKGSLKRPWAQPDHPKNARCVELTNAVLNDPDFTGAEMNEILAEVDRLMAPRQRPAAAVLPDRGGTREVKKKTPNLNEEQKMVARRMYPDLSATEAVKRYGAAVSTLGVT